MALLFVVVGMLVGIVLIRYGLRPKNQILYLRERDGRGMELNVQDEDAISLETSSKPVMRFFKYGRAYDFIRRGRAFTRFFGKEGTAYTWRLQGFSKVASKFKKVIRKVQMLNNGKAIVDKAGDPVFEEVSDKVAIEWENKKLDLPFPMLEDAVKHVLGKEAYEQMPEPMQAKLRDQSMLVTVNLEPGIVPEGYEPITESIIEEKADEDMASLLGESVKGAIKSHIIDKIPWIGVGIAIGFGIYIFMLR